MNYKINTYQKKDSNFDQLSLFIKLSFLFPTRISLRSLRKPRFPLKLDNSLDTASKHLYYKYASSILPWKFFQKSISTSGCGRAFLCFKKKNYLRPENQNKKRDR